MVNILALDIATHTGYCHEFDHGCWDLSSKRDESKGLRLLKLKKLITDTITKYNINLVVYERVSGFHKSSLIVASELVGVVKAYCEEHKIDYKAYSATEIKKHATGKGNANKAMMVLAAKNKLGCLTDDDNEADAMWLYDLAKSEMG